LVSPPPPELRTAAPEWVTGGIRAAEACPTPAGRTAAREPSHPSATIGACRTAPADSSDPSTHHRPPCTELEARHEDALESVGVVWSLRPMRHRSIGNPATE
jgi:hypothetical protein